MKEETFYLCFFEDIYDYIEEMTADGVQDHWQQMDNCNYSH